MASYNRHSHTLPQLCDSCLLRVSKATMEDEDVIFVFAKLGRSVCSFLTYDVIPQLMQQQIKRARSDVEALFFIRDAFCKSLEPHMVDQLLHVLGERGNSLYAENVRNIYHRNIMAHKLCKNCKKGPVVNSLADITKMDFTPEERKDLAAQRIINVMPLGESMTGKTTLLSTIIKGESSLAKERTSVASLHRWTPPQDPDVTALLYDVGGHKSYQNTAHCFQVNSNSTLNLLCHRMDAQNVKKSCEATLEWFDIVQTSAPKSKTKLVFTQFDRLKEKCRHCKMCEIKEQFKKLFKEKQVIKERHRNESNANKDLHEMHIQNYQDIIDQLEKSNSVPCISCIDREKDSVKFVVDLILQFANEPKDQQTLTPIDQDLFKEIGTLGLKTDMILDDDVIAGNENPNPETQERMEQEQHNVRETSEDQVPKHTVETRQKHQQQHVTLDKVRETFHRILKKHYHDYQDSDLEKELQKSLQNLKNQGLIRYFTGRKRLAEIIFNDISTMVNILRCIFQHELSEFPQFMDLPKDLRKDLKLTETAYKKDVQYLTKHAIISSGLVELLLKKSKCSLSEDIVLQLLAELNIAFPISVDCNVAFIPYFLRDCIPDSVVDEEKKIANCYHTTLALHCVLRGQIPRPYFNELMVKLYGEMYQKCVNQKANITWVDGLSAALGKYQTKLLLLYNSRKKIIEFIIQANIEEIEGHHFLFKQVKFINNETVDIRDAMFEGLPIEFELICTDCSRKDPNTRCVWDIRLCLDDSELNEDTISCEKEENIPCALLQPLPKDEKRAKYCHRKLLDYLKKHYTEEPTSVQTQGATGMSESQPADDINKPIGELKQGPREHTNKIQSKLSRLCDACHLTVTRTTFGRQDVIQTLRKLGRGFCFCLSDSIVTGDMRQRIEKAVTDDEVLGHIRDAFNNSLDPKMLTQVLEVLRLDDIGKAMHADYIEKAYHEELDIHELCEKCNTDEKRAKSCHSKLQEYLKKHYSKEPEAVQTQGPTGITESQPVSGSQCSLPPPVQETGARVSGVPPAVRNRSEMGEIIVKQMAGHQIDELKQKEHVYKIRRQTRGRALIINMRRSIIINKDKQQKLDERLGSEHDVTKLQHLFRQLHFEPKVYEDLSKQDMKNVFREEWQKQNSMDPDAFILCIMSHGCQHNNRDFIYSYDGERLDVDGDICTPLGQCDKLKGKPKLVIIQACRSDPTKTKRESELDCAPTDKADLLIAFSSVQDWNSYRIPGEGSYFIQTIARVFSEDAYRSHVVDMLTKVRDEVAKRPKEQLTQDVNQLKKQFYFFPGYI